MNGKAWTLVVLILFVFLLDGCHVDRTVYPIPESPDALPPDFAEKVLSLDPNALSEKDVVEVLSRCAAPRIVALDGSLPIIPMESFTRFLILMGYPEASVRDPRKGSYSYSSYRSSREMAGMIAWYYEKDGMRPMVIGHSQGGMLSIKILHELAGTFREKIAVWNPYSGEPEERYTIIDPIEGREHPVVGLKLGFASAIATGKGMRFLLGQWDMVSQLRKIPDTVEEFTGFHLQHDLISGTLFGVGQGDRYYPVRSAVVRNVILPAKYSHLGIPLTEDLARNREIRQWINSYTPANENLELKEVFEGDSRNILFAADLWYSIKRHWCMELQRWVLARGKTGRE